MAHRQPGNPRPAAMRGRQDKRVREGPVRAHWAWMCLSVPGLESASGLSVGSLHLRALLTSDESS